MVLPGTKFMTQARQFNRRVVDLEALYLLMDGHPEVYIDSGVAAGVWCIVPTMRVKRDVPRADGYGKYDHVRHFGNEMIADFDITKLGIPANYRIDGWHIEL